MSDEIIGFVVERIADLIAGEVNLLRGAKDKFVRLQRELEMMQSFLIDADAKLEAGDHRLRTIVNHITDLAHEAEDLIDREEKAKLSFLKRMISFCSCLVHTHQMGTEVEQLISQIRETTARLQAYQVQTNVQVIRRDRPQSYPHSIGDDNVVGFDNDVEVLVQRLIKDRDDKILGIAGMGGSGKTTMARKIYNHSQICHHFECKAWVCVSQTWNHESLLKEILRQTTGQSGEGMTPQIIEQEIYKLLQGKSYLIVLDDVWEQEALRKIMGPTATLHGSKFLVTTRIREVIRFSDLGCYIHEPRRLTPDESWDLFRKKAFGRQSNEIMEPFVLLGKEMLKKCDGLPLAVVALGGLLSMKSSIDEWERVKSNVSSKIIGEKVGPFDYGRVEDMLALSYSDLDHTLKSCFMYLGLFPEDKEIETRGLMHCWIAEGFFKSVKYEGSMEDVAKNRLGELIQRCLVQVVEVNYDEVAERIKVHDLMRDLAIKRANEKSFMDTIPSSSTAAGTTTLQQQPRRLGGVMDSELEDILEGGHVCNGSPRLRSFISYVKCPMASSPELEMSLKNMFTNYPLLRVLVLTMSPADTNFIRIPDEIGKLIHLRHFHISFALGTTIHLPNSIKNLRNLLSFSIHAIHVKPSPDIKQMKQLTYLCMPLGNKQESLNLQHSRSLKVLLNLSGGPWMLRELKLLSPTVEKLRILNITGCEQLDAIFECPSIVQDRLYSLSLTLESGEFQVQKLQHCNNLKYLDLHGKIAATKSVALAFPPHLVELILSESEIEEHDTLVDALVRLPYLKILNLQYRSYKGSQLNFPANSMLHLQCLNLFSLENLEEIHVKEGAMPLLNSVDILRCKKLKVLPQRFS